MDDEPGLRYHFPVRYLKYLQPGTNVIYYKGKLIDKEFHSHRLSINPHYFAIGTIEKLSKEEGTTNYYALIKDFAMFSKAVPFKIDEKPLEIIPEN